MLSTLQNLFVRMTTTHGGNGYKDGSRRRGGGGYVCTKDRASDDMAKFLSRREQDRRTDPAPPLHPLLLQKQKRMFHFDEEPLF